MPHRALKLIYQQSDESMLAHDWSRAVAASCAWAMLPTLDSYFLARAAWGRVEADWLRLLAGRR